MVTKENKKKTLVVLDTHAIIHRAYHALPDFVSSKGEPTGALYGLVTMLLRIIGDLKPDYVVACYDRADKTFRKQVYENYKATRAKADNELVSQLEKSRELIEALQIPVYDKAGFEADDIIGTIVEATKGNKDLQVIIASGDMDTLQLVDKDRVTVYTLKRGLSETITYDEAGVEKRFSFGPKLLPDYKGLAGDQSDNIVGIKGIGDKTATILISKFGTIEQIYKALAKGEEKFEKAGIKKRVIGLLKEGEEEALFSKALATIRRDAAIKFKLPSKAWRETAKLEPVEKLFAELEFRTLGTRFKNLLSSLDGKLDQLFPAETEEEVVPQELCIALWLLNSDITSPKTEDILQFSGTKDLAGAEKKLLAEIKEKKLEKIYREVELPLIPIIKAAEERGILIDAGYLKKLSKGHHQELDKLETNIHKQAEATFNINSPKQLGEVLFDKLHLQAKGLKKTAGGARSTRESELLKLQDAHPIIGEILAYRELQKLLSTYIDAIPPKLDKGGRLHTNLNQTGTTTGRMSSTDPNLQNIPAKTKRGEAIRRAFVATPGYQIASFDYAQVEMRVLALLSGDGELIRIFNSKEDAHTSVAQKVFGVSEEEVTKEMRRRAKVINFGIIYGMGVNALKKNLSSSPTGETVTREEAQHFYNQYFETFPKIKNYFEEVITGAKKDGYTETLFGRRRYFPGLKSRLPFVKAMNERMAMNAPLQGTAADIVKLAMTAVDKMLREEKVTDEAHLLLQVHDELLYEIKEESVKKLLPKIEAAMESVIDDVVPFSIHAAAADNWGELK
ncbi:MAG: DNA polymerase [Patescibacteria group bacterium]|nr:DNA polymerase [Patescibacteria group bacterium]